jgi:hypothetical protein
MCKYIIVDGVRHNANHIQTYFVNSNLLCIHFKNIYMSVEYDSMTIEYESEELAENYMTALDKFLTTNYQSFIVLK